MKTETKARILELNAKGLSEYFISKELGITSWQARKVIVKEINKDRFLD